jgi:hypothetical protein
MQQENSRAKNLKKALDLKLPIKNSRAINLEEALYLPPPIENSRAKNFKEAVYLPPPIQNSRAENLKEALDFKKFKEDLKISLDSKNKNKDIDTDVYDFFSALIEKQHHLYDEQAEVLIIMDDNYKDKLLSNGMTEDQLDIYISEQIRIINTNYKTADSIYEVNFNLLKLTDELHKTRLKERERLYNEIIDNENLLPKFAQLFNKDIEVEEDLKQKIKNILQENFTFDFDEIFNGDKIFSPYIYMLAKKFDEIRTSRQLSTDVMIGHDIWKKPPFNNPRDYILTTSTKYPYVSYEDVISFEYKLMKILFEEKILQNDFNNEQLNLILGSYRNCVFGNNEFLEMYVDNSKYFDAAPFFFIYSECKINNLCKITPNLSWNIRNNQIGIENAAHRRLIFPYVVIEDNIKARLDVKAENFTHRIGILIFRKDNKYYCYYMSVIIGILNNQAPKISLYDIYKNTVYLKDSTFGYMRNQLLESKYAIEALIKNLLRNKFEPYTEKDCNIIVFALNKKINGKQLYYLSLYNKDEIVQMYTNLLATFKSLDNEKLNDLINKYIIMMNNDLTELSEYRYVRKKPELLEDITEDRKKPYIFIWNIDQSEVGEKFEVSKQIRKSSCIRSTEYNNIFTGNLKIYNFYKGEEEMDLAINLDESVKMYIDLQKYEEDSDYKSFIDKQKEKINRDRNHSKTKREIEDKNNFYGRLSDVFKEVSDLTEKPNYKNIFTDNDFYSDDPQYTLFTIELDKPVKYYINLLKYTQDQDYKDHINEQKRLLGEYNYNYQIYNKYIKYKKKYLILYNKMYNSNI